MTANRESPPNPLPCGCRVAGTLLLPSQAHNLHVEFCSLHGAAPELLKALESIVETCYCEIPRDTACVAIAKARPPKVERAGEENPS